MGKKKLFIHTFQSEIPKIETCRKVLVTLKGVNNGCKVDIVALEIENISNASKWDYYIRHAIKGDCFDTFYCWSFE